MNAENTLVSAWQSGEDLGFVETLAEKLFPKRPAPPLDGRSEPQLRRKVRRILAEIGKVHPIECLETACKSILARLVSLLWPAKPEQQLKVVAASYTISLSSKPKPVLRHVSFGKPGRIHDPVKENHAEIYFTAADADWWKTAWFVHEREYWQTRKQQEREAYIAWWNDTLLWKETRFQQEQNYLQSQQNLRELARKEYANWWLKTLRYVEWWEKILSPVQVAKPRQLCEEPVVFAKTVAQTRDQGFIQAEDSGNAILYDLRKSTVDYNPQPARKRWEATAKSSDSPEGEEQKPPPPMLPKGAIVGPKVRSAHAMQDNIDYWTNHGSAADKVEQARKSIKACRRYFPSLDLTPRKIKYYGLPGVRVFDDRVVAEPANA